MSVYGALLWLDRVRDVPWLYVIWTAASLFNHFVCRVFYKPSKLLAHYSLLGNAFSFSNDNTNPTADLPLYQHVLISRFRHPLSVIHYPSSITPLRFPL